MQLAPCWAAGGSAGLDLLESLPRTPDLTVVELRIKLRLHGIGLSLDDYGVGFSSMMRLSRIPFTELKIDRSLVHDARPHLLPLLSSAIRLASDLGIEAMAEGVENAAGLDVLRQLGCHQVQGCLLARPMPAHEPAELACDWPWGRNAY